MSYKHLIHAPLQYYVRTEVFLSLEEFNNAGLTEKDCKEVIERFQDPGGAMNLDCYTTHINDNLKFTTWLTDPEDVHDLVQFIKLALLDKLKEKVDKANKHQ